MSLVSHDLAVDENPRAVVLPAVFLQGTDAATRSDFPAKVKGAPAMLLQGIGATTQSDFPVKVGQVLVILLQGTCAAAT